MDFNVIVATPAWYLSGVNVFAANLVRGLQEKGIPARVLITQPEHAEANPLPLPTDIPVDIFPAGRSSKLPARWETMIRYLEAKRPCVYVPNHDYLHSCLCPKLPDDIVVIGHIHGPVDHQYEQFQALGKYWNATVTANQAILQDAAALCPDLADRLTAIPYSATFPTSPPDRPFVPGAPLRMLYAGRLVQEAKRVRDLPGIVQALVARGVPVHLTLTGQGEEEGYLKRVCRNLCAQGIVRFRGTLPDAEYAEVIRQSDVFLLPSEFDGMPLALIEAMGHGCVPVVTDIPGGLAEVVHDGENGFRVPVGNIEAFADRLTLLQRDPARRQELSLKAFDTVDRGGFRNADMTQRYLDLFHAAWSEMKSGAYRRPRGEPVMWPMVHVLTRRPPIWVRWLPLRFRILAGRWARQLGLLSKPRPPRQQTERPQSTRETR